MNYLIWFFILVTLVGFFSFWIFVIPLILKHVYLRITFKGDFEKERIENPELIKIEQKVKLGGKILIAYLLFFFIFIIAFTVTLKFF